MKPCNFYTYYITINTKEYKLNYDKHKEAKGDFKQVLDMLKIQKKFFKDFPNELYTFYKELITYGLKK